MPRTKLSTAVRRDQIAEATLAEVAQHGLAGLNVAAVARRVGIAPSALYRHFSGKDAVVDVVLERLRERLQANVAVVRAAHADPVEALRELLQRHVALLREHRGLPLVVLGEASGERQAGRRPGVLGVFSAYLGAIAALVRTGQRRGLIRRDVPAPTLAVMFIGLFQPSALLWSLSEGEFDIARQVREAWPVFEQAIRVPAAPVARPARRAASRRSA